MKGEEGESGAEGDNEGDSGEKDGVVRCGRCRESVEKSWRYCRWCGKIQPERAGTKGTGMTIGEASEETCESSEEEMAEIQELTRSLEWREREEQWRKENQAECIDACDVGEESGISEVM